MDHTQPIDPRKTIFIGGVPRPLKACELADIFNSRYGNVCYAGIDCDPELKYPKGMSILTSSHRNIHVDSRISFVEISFLRSFVIRSVSVLIALLSIENCQLGILIEIV